MPTMQTRKRLYELLHYDDYSAFDSDIVNFRTAEGRHERTQVFKGLAGVVVDTTAVSMVNAETNSLTYRGYPVQQLAASCSFEQVAYLIWYGELPTADQLRGPSYGPSGRSGYRPDELFDVLAGLPLRLPPDGRPAHGGEHPRCRGPDARRHRRRGQPGPVGAADGPAAVGRRLRPAPSPRRGAHRPRPGAGLRGKLPPDVLRGPRRLR